MAKNASHIDSNGESIDEMMAKLCVNQPFLRKAYKRETLVRLHNDHVNICLLLDIFEKHLAELVQGGKPDLLLMRDIIEYMVNYPDIVHHPLEEMLFRRLKKADTESHGIISELESQHQRLGEYGKSLLAELERVTSGAIMEKEKILRNCCIYMELLYSHMNMEEERIFPRIERLFSISDWSEVGSTLETIQDPVFGEAVQDYYRRLYDRIQTEIRHG